MKSVQSRNYTLDVIKLISSFFIVFIHVPFHGIAGEVIRSISRFAVPVFFMTSGFFSYENDTQTILRRIKKLSGILIFASCLYNTTNILSAFASSGMGGLADYFSQFIEVKGWLLLLFFNQSFSAYRLWFILALIYVYVLQILIHKAKISYRAVAILSVCAVVLHIFFGAIPAALGFEPQEYFCRNYLLFGFPFFGFGLFMRHHQDKFSNLSPVMLTACLILGCILSPSLMMYQTGSQISIGSLLIAFSIFCYALKHSTVTYSAWVIQLTQCSLGIYIFHRPVSTIVRKSFSLFGLIRHPILCDIIGPILVCIFSTILTLALKQLQKKHQAASRKS